MEESVQDRVKESKDDTMEGSIKCEEVISKDDTMEENTKGEEVVNEALLNMINSSPQIDENAISQSAQVYNDNVNISSELKFLFLLKTITHMDLTSLTGSENQEDLKSLVSKGINPLQSVSELNLADFTMEIFRQLIENSKIENKGGDNLWLRAMFDKDNENIPEMYKKFLDLSGIGDTDAENLDSDFIKVAAFCVFPKFVKDLTGHLSECGKKYKSMNVASAAEMHHSWWNKEISNQRKKVSLIEMRIRRLRRKYKVPTNPEIEELVIAKKRERRIYTNLMKENVQKIGERANTSAEPSSRQYYHDKVAGNFPSAKGTLRLRAEEVVFAVVSGATEVDVVINRTMVSERRWQLIFNELSLFKLNCGNAKLKTILSVGECGSLDNVFKASIVAMAAGTDFIKTSTGKEKVNANFSAGIVMCRAIKFYYELTGRKVGFKPAGGINTAENALQWIKLVLNELGPEWLTSSLFRIGASRLVADVVQNILALHSTLRKT